MLNAGDAKMSKESTAPVITEHTVKNKVHPYVSSELTVHLFFPISTGPP